MNNVRKPNKLTDDQRREIIRRYESGETGAKIAASHGVSATAVYQLLRTRGVVRRPANNKPKFNADFERLAAQRYVSGESASDIARSFSVDIGTVLNMLRRQGVEKRSASEIRRKYKADHSFFDQIDNELKAYWLGFIAADGYVNDTSGRGAAPEIKIVLSIKDEQHLYLFREHLQSAHPIARYKLLSGKGAGNEYCRFSLRSAQIAAGLAKHHIARAKTHSLRWPDLPIGLLRHYLRGYLDGDGGLYVRKPRKPGYVSVVRFQITSNISFLLSARSFMMEAASLPETKISVHTESEDIGTLIWGGRKQLKRIYELLYEDATVCLPRKRDPMRHELFAE